MHKNNKNVYHSVKYFTFLSQIGISVIIPVFLCIFGATWLKNTFELGNWVVLVGILLGLGGGAISMIKYMKVAIRDAERSQDGYNQKKQ